MADRSTLPFRVLRAGLRAASRAGSTVVERVLRDGVSDSPAARLPSGRRPATGPLTVCFDGRDVPVRAGASLLEAAKLADVDLRSYCGGNCSCGTCRVIIESGAENLSTASGMESMVLGMEASRRGDRLACQAAVHGRVVVKIPEFF